MYNDRLEISNPGGLYGNLTVEELTEVINPPVRNKTLIRILEELDIIENRSSGIATMIMSMRGLHLEPPIFENKRGNFNVIFKNHTLMNKDDRKWLEKINIQLSENEALSLIYLRSNGRMTNGDYQKINNVNRDKALQELKGLIKKGLIECFGIGSGSYYMLRESIEKIEEAQEEAQEYTKLNLNETEFKIIELLKEGAISKLELANKLGYKSITGNIKRAVENLISKQIIKYTIPDKPTSKFQKLMLK